ncbi:MAG: hypothetical protein CBD26_02845 [Candidatus Pelagibacter sp. TMED166]|nr:MAG: hypothetical protein CBD26_02845 [Candidatus Pelagibacter sp. TMED166]|tara:strand:+ start:590 stop:1147 length:558 start_codon:yes stop_codon:yes gene_type:complete
MLKNIIYIVGILATAAVYYLFYDYQDKRFQSIESKLIEISSKIDNISNEKPSKDIVESLNYKENNFLKNDIVNFSDSLIKLFDNDTTIQKISNLSKIIDTVDVSDSIQDTFCFDLAEQYKIINFYNNKIRIKNLLVPGSILLSLNDSLIHNEIVYILKEINGEGSYIELQNTKTQTDCKFHKISK